jgi:hypothetical protein
MEKGSYYEYNAERVIKLSERDWVIALNKCKKHIRLRLKQKTLFGAHSQATLGADPVDYYLSDCTHKLMFGIWEWKNEFTLLEQLIRIINSSLSKGVEKTQTTKAKEFKIIYRPIEEEFYDLDIPDTSVDDIARKKQLEENIKITEDAINGDNELEFFWEAIKEGKKRADIADLLDIKPKQLDKIKERFIRKIKAFPK